MIKMTIILEKSHTLIGKIGRWVSPYPYTHIALTFDDVHYQSFSRRHHYNPFDSGFTVETMKYYAYSRKEPVEIKEYPLTITLEQKEEIESFIDSIREYPFDLYGMIQTSLGRPREKTNAYNCMTFIAHVLEIIGIPLVKEPAYRNTIEDLEKALIQYGIKGEVKKYSFMGEDEEYMRKVSIQEKIHSFLALNQKLRKK